MLETVLMRAFLMLYSTDFVDDRQRMSRKSRSSESQAYRVLSSVRYSWWKTLPGWPESPTSQWVRHQLKKLVASECTFTWTNIVILSVCIEYVKNYCWNLMNCCGLFSMNQGKFDSSLWYMLYTLSEKKTRQLQRHDINILTKKLPGRQREKGMAPGPGLDPPLIHTMHNTSSVAIFMQYFVIYNSVNLTTQLWNWFNVWSNCYGNLKHCHHTQLNCNWTKTSWLI